MCTLHAIRFNHIADIPQIIGPHQNHERKERKKCAQRPCKINHNVFVIQFESLNCHRRLHSTVEGRCDKHFAKKKNNVVSMFL